MKSFKQFLKEEHFPTTVRKMIAQRDAFLKRGELPPGVDKIRYASSEELGPNVEGEFRGSSTHVFPKSQTSWRDPAAIRHSRISLLNPDEWIKQRLENGILPRKIRRHVHIERAAQSLNSMTIHEFGHNYQAEKQVPGRIKDVQLQVDRLQPGEGGLMDGYLKQRHTPMRESRGKRRNRQRAEMNDMTRLPFERLNQGRGIQTHRIPVTKQEEWIDYRNLDTEGHSRSLQYGADLHDLYKRDMQIVMKRNPKMSVDDITRLQLDFRNHYVKVINSKEIDTAPKIRERIIQRTGLVMDDIVKELDLTTPEKINAFKKSKIPPVKHSFPVSLGGPRPDTTIEKVVAVRDDVVGGLKKVGKRVVNSIDVAIDPLGYALEKGAQRILDIVKGGVKSGVKSGVKGVVKEVVKSGVKGIAKGVGVSVVGGIIGDQLAKHVAVPALEKLGVYDAVGDVSKVAFENMPSWAVAASERILAGAERLVDNPIAFAIDTVTSPGSFKDPQGTTTITTDTKTEIQKRKDFDNHIRKNPQLTNDEVLELTKKEEERIKKESPSDSEMTTKHTAPVVATSDKISNWFDRNVINPIFGESYDISKEQYKEHIRSVLLEKYKRIRI